MGKNPESKGPESKGPESKGTVLALPWVDLAKLASVVREEKASPQASERQPVTSSEALGGNYEGAFRRVSERLLQSDRILADERLSAPALFVELLGHPIEDRFDLVCEDSRFHSYLLAEMCLEKGREFWFDHPLRAVDWAKLALAAAERLDTTFYGASLPAGLRLKGYAYLGNALRIRMDLLEAQEAFRKVDELLSDGVFNSSERAEILSLKVSFCKDTRRFDEAERLLEELTLIYEQSGDEHQQGRAMLQKATILSMQGHYAGSAKVMRSGIELLDPRREPRAILSSWISLAFFYVQSDQHDAADDALAQAREPVKRLGDRLSMARIRFVEGRIAASREQFEVAEKAFIEAREIFMERSISFDTGLASLDLAVIYIQQGKLKRVRAITEEVVLLFRGHETAPEIMAAIILFQHAAEREIATVSLVKEISKYLERSRDFGTAL